MALPNPTALLLLTAALAAQTPIGYFLPQTPAVATPDSLRESLAFDALRQCVVTIRYDSQQRTTWEYDGGTWRQSLAATPFFFSTPLCYDPLRQRVVAVGSWNGGEGVMEYDGTTWTQVPSAPAALTAGSNSGRLVFDTSRGVMVFVTNGTGSSTTTTWERVGTAWFQRTTGGPPARSGFGCAFDPLRGVVVVHGGTGPFGHLGDTWQWNGLYWLQQLAAAPVRYAHSMVFDPYRGRVMFYGGFDANNNVPTTISEWDGTAWTQLAANGIPAANVNQIAVDFPPRQSVLFTGGINNVSITLLYRAQVPDTGQLAPFGAGCAGTGAALTMQGVGALPRVGRTFTASLGNVPAGAFTLGMFGTDNTQWNGSPLPLDLANFGFVGCNGYVAPTSVTAVPAIGSAATWSIGVPPEHSFVGLRFYLQGAALLAGVNVGGALFSNGLAGRIGTP